MDDIKVPTVYRKHLLNWKTFQKWSLDYLAEMFHRQVKFEIGSLNEKRENIRNDTDLSSVNITLKEFKDWLQGNTVPKLIDFNKNTHYAYCSYQYVNELFENYEQLIDDIDWTYFGLENHMRYQTVLWLGSPGSFTNCHYDTYGFNVICQLRGCKKWLLFPPSDTDNLYPTRFPYEESSVFSCVDFRSVNLSQYGALNQTHPRMIVLQPGDVLILPHHWWHFVQAVNDDTYESSDDYSLSINLWLDDNNRDLDNRISEALTKMGLLSFFDSDLMSNYSTMFDYSDILSENWTVETLEILNGLLEEKNNAIKKNYHLTGLENGMEVAAVYPTDVFSTPNNASKNEGDDDSFTFESNFLTQLDILDAFTHPEVIQLVQKILMEKVNIKK